MKSIIAAASIAVLAASSPCQTTPPTPAPILTPGGGRLADKLINVPGAAWSVFGAKQTNEAQPKAGPQGYPATRVSISAKGANAWDAGAVSPIAKPIAAGDTVLVAVYLRAPELRAGEATLVSYVGLNQSAAPYDVVVQTPANVTNEWKLFFASGRATKAYTADAVVVGVHLANDKNVIDLGPVRVFDLGRDVDPARLPKNG